MYQFTNQIFFLLSRRHFNWLQQAISKILINFLSQKGSCASMMIDPVINVFIPNVVIINSHICDHSIISFGKRGLFLGFSNASHVNNLYRFREVVVEKVHNAIDNLNKKQFSRI